MKILLKTIALLALVLVLAACPQATDDGVKMHTVTFVGNEGTVKKINDSGELVEVSSISVESGKTLSNLPLSLKDDYAFLGWFDSSGAEFTARSIVTADITLTAKLIEANLDASYYVKTGVYYIVDDTNVTTKASGDVIIASSYNGLPVTTIGDYAFDSCNVLTSVTIPNTVTTIGNRAFRECKAITSITIPDSVKIIGVYTFFNCDTLTNVVIPDSVTTIGKDAFSSCDALTSVTLGNSVTTIGEFAFRSCHVLTSVILGSSVTTISGGAFYNCPALTSVTLGNSVTTIGEYAFFDTDALTSITIPASVTTIGYNVFSHYDGPGFQIDVEGKTEAQKPAWDSTNRTGWHDDWDIKNSDGDKHKVNWNQ